MNDHDRNAAVTSLVLAEGCPPNLEADLLEARANFQAAEDALLRAATTRTGPFTLVEAAGRLSEAARRFVVLADERDGYVWAALARLAVLLATGTLANLLVAGSQ